MSIDTDTFRPLHRGRTRTHDFPTIRFYPTTSSRLAYLNAVARETLDTEYLRFFESRTTPGIILLAATDEGMEGPDAYKLGSNGLVTAPKEIHERAAGKTYRLSPTARGMLLDLNGPET